MLDVFSNFLAITIDKELLIVILLVVAIVAVTVWIVKALR